MYCVIQEIPTKKPDRGGYGKELQASYMQIIIGDRDEGHYTYEITGKFERPIKKSYKISIHQSFRENGKVKKKQYSICTIHYYDIATDFFTLYDWADYSINAAADALNCDPDDIYTLIMAKLEPLQKSIKAEFQKTEEYKTHREHERIIERHSADKAHFNEKYGLTGYEYDQCYDVFGTLRNPERLAQIQQEYQTRQEYERKSRSYRKSFYSNYSFNTPAPDLDKTSALKEIYKAAAKALHPDANPNKDTSKAMQVLNDLKSEWGI